MLRSGVGASVLGRCEGPRLVDRLFELEMSEYSGVPRRRFS